MSFLLRLCGFAVISTIGTSGARVEGRSATVLVVVGTFVCLAVVTFELVHALRISWPNPRFCTWPLAKAQGQSLVFMLVPPPNPMSGGE